MSVDFGGAVIFVLSVLVLWWTTIDLAYKAGRYKETGRWPE